MTEFSETRIRKDIQVRIVQDRGYYIGYIYNNQKDLKETDEYILLDRELEPGWNQVTEMTFTRKGCKREVLGWLKRHTIEEYVIVLEKK